MPGWQRSASRGALHSSLHSGGRIDSFPSPSSNGGPRRFFGTTPGNEFSRKGLTLALAQLDGGAHVDPTLEEAYAALSRSNSLGWTFHVGDEALPDESPVPANVRQVAYELQATIEEQLADLIA